MSVSVLIVSIVESRGRFFPPSGVASLLSLLHIARDLAIKSRENTERVATLSQGLARVAAAHLNRRARRAHRLACIWLADADQLALETASLLALRARRGFSKLSLALFFFDQAAPTS